LELTGLPSVSCLSRLGSDYVTFFENNKNQVQAQDFKKYFEEFIKDSSEGFKFNSQNLRNLFIQFFFSNFKLLIFLNKCLHLTTLNE